MPDRILRTVPIWMFGKRYDFNVYEVANGAARVPLAPEQFEHTGANTPVTHQKNQIVLHFTAGNGPASGTLDWWNTMAARPKFFCPKWDEAGINHHYGQDTAGTCPTAGHGTLRAHFGGAHFVLELSQDRLTPATQPYSDVIEIIQTDASTWHGESVNTNSIGIEHANVGTTWEYARHDAMTGAGTARRPVDTNRYYRTPANTWATSNLNHTAQDFQAYQEEQYLAMILLLRHLCIKHRIPRRFLGETTEEKMSRWWNDLPANLQQIRRSKLMRFRGILSHMNCHATKNCGGPALHRNRLFRGIIDEWWLPVQFDGLERPYYMGPFDPQPSLASYFRFSGGAMQEEVFRDTNLDALQETKSYFDFDHLEFYYAQTERPTEGGTYPVGTNRIWHGGVHLEPGAGNRKVYAAGSGTIVAARLGGDAATESDAQYGSQRFILIRHCVHTATEVDPGGGRRTNYTPDPTYVFTLYMHLAPVAPPGNLTAADNHNPPWLNYWLRHRTAAADANAVFCPNVEVSVGDWIGECGTYRGRRMIHFEVVSRTELTDAPWDSPNHRFHDPDSNILCDIPALDRFVTDRVGDGVDTMDILRGARELRRVKAYHKSEWSLTGPDALAGVITNPAVRQQVWDKLQHFMWVAAAVAACPDLATQLCDATGMMWHYHPFTFMEFIDRRIEQENGQVSEPDFRNTNVAMEGDYLTGYVSFAGGVSAPAAADAQKVKPFDISANTFEYSFTRAELACQGPGAHDPPPAPPNATHFHVALLDIIENVRRIYDQGLRVNLAHLCAGHDVAAQNALCVLNSGPGRHAHAEGIAVDISPTGPTPAKCRQLWNAISDAHASYDSSCGDHGGEPSRSDLPEGFNHLQVAGPPDIITKLTAGTALNAAEAARCVFHLQLARTTWTVVWDAWTRLPSQAAAARAEGMPGLMNIIGVYNSQAAAEAERASPSEAVTPQGTVWECVVKRNSTAVSARVDAGGIIASYATAEQAENEKSAGNAWPREE